MRELSPSRAPFIPAKYDALPAARSSYFPEGALCSNSGLGSNDYWFGVRTTTRLPFERVVVCIQTSTHSPANDYWFAPPPHIAIHLLSALFILHSPTEHTSPPIRSLVLSPRNRPSPKGSEKFFTPCKCLAYGEMNATQRVLLRNILR